ncbi:MAG: hypothetical protein HUJ13_10855 [Hydrogenovibrio crunogenus]|nr:hypothetical protein [Hydrogenovibrio crunogenus]
MNQSQNHFLDKGVTFPKNQKSIAKCGYPHKIAVIECDYSMLFDPSNKESMNKAQELIKQTPFPNVLNEIKEEEKVIKSAQKNIRNLKHKVERITREGGYE